MNTQFSVLGMTCDACAKRIALQVKRLPGVQDAVVSREHGTLNIMSEQTMSREMIQSSLEGTPYQIIS